MIIRNLLRARPAGVVAAAAIGIGFATAAPTSAASADAFVANDTLTVTGTSHSDVVALRLAAGDPNTLQVDFGNDGSAEFSFDRATFSAIFVNLRSGADELRVGTGFGDEGLTIDSGSGADTIFGGDNNATIRTGSGDDFVQGGNGVEQIDTGSGRDFVDGGRGNDVAVLGSGADAFQWDPGEGSDTIDGKTGNDVLIFNGASGDEKMSLSAEGSRSVFLRNVANIRMDMDNVEQLDLNALGGVDEVTINDMTGTDFRQANVDLGVAGAGDNALDTVTVAGTDNVDNISVQTDGSNVDVAGLKTVTHISGSEVRDQLNVDTRAGDDQVTVGDGVGAVIGFTIA